MFPFFRILKEDPLRKHSMVHGSASCRRIVLEITLDYIKNEISSC